MSRKERIDPSSIPDTRQGRRYKATHSNAPTKIQFLDLAIENLAVTNKAYNESILPETPSLCAMIYQNGQPAFLAYADAIRSVYVAARAAQKIEANDPRIGRLMEKELYSHRIRGVSLADIEQMPLPLSLTDISRINRLFNQSLISRFIFGYRDHIIQHIATGLPVFELARPQEFKTPVGLKPLQARLSSYLDYYLGYINLPQVDIEKDMDLLWALSFGRRGLIQGLAYYIPARLGITPASGIKLFDEKAAIHPYPMAWELLKKRTANEMCHAYRIDALPPAISKYLHYDQTSDTQASKLFKAYLEGQSSDNQPDQISDQDMMFLRYRRYQKVLRADVLKSEEKFLRLPMTHPLIREVIIASQYKQTMMFILLLNNDQAHLTLEVNGNNRVYGIPGDLLRESPHSGDLLIKEVLGAVLNYALQQYPNVEPAIIEVRAPAQPEVMPDMYSSDDKPDQSEKVSKPPKRKTLPPIFTEPKLPEPVTPTEHKFNVSYTRTQVQTPHRLPDDIVDRIMRDLQLFELGKKKVKPLEDVPNHFSLRSGDHRSILEHTGNRQYVFKEAGSRSSIYRDLGRFR